MLISRFSLAWPSLAGIGAGVNPRTILQLTQDRAPGRLLYVALQGSRLFGTQRAGSDYDLKGVYLPPLVEALSGRIRDALSFKYQEAEVTLWSFQQWLSLLAVGDTNAIDLYFATTHPEGVWLDSPQVRRFFETCPARAILPRNLKGMRGFARSQAIKYGAKGDHYRIAKTVLEAANRYAGTSQEAKVGTFWAELSPTPEFRDLLHRFPDRLGLTQAPDGYQVVMVLDKLFHLEAPLSLMQRSLEGVVASYGQRAILSGVKGADWKAMSHSLRVLEEVTELHTTGGVVFPLAGAHLLRQVKLGEIEQATVLQMLEEREKEASQAEQKSLLLERPDQQLLEQALLGAYGLQSIVGA